MRKLVSAIFNFFTFWHYEYVTRGTHIEMSELYYDKLKLVSFEEFKQEFDKVEWEPIRQYKYSLRSVKPFYGECHASMFQIGGIAYIFKTSYDIILANKMIKKRYNQLRYI